MSFFRKLFSKPKTEPLEASTPLPEPQLPDEIQPEEEAKPGKELSPGLHVGQLTDVGQVREFSNPFRNGVRQLIASKIQIG